MGGMADEVADFDLVESIGLLLRRIALDPLAVIAHKSSMFSSKLKLGDR
ncbi:MULTISPECIES: hypothetical protein [unclassified Pseudomonas]|nr:MULTISPECIES: hypothetical protein [unclassified Pseudomonas]